jgi:hypothetical protein
MDVINNETHHGSSPFPYTSAVKKGVLPQLYINGHPFYLISPGPFLDHFTQLSVLEWLITIPFLRHNSQRALLSIQTI